MQIDTLTPAEREQLTWWKYAYEARGHYRFDPVTARRLAFVRLLIRDGRLGADDQAAQS